MQSIREGDFIGVRYDVKGHADPFEIYNVVTDPKQTKNLAAEQPELQQRMHDAVLRMRRPDASARRPYDGELIPAVAGKAGAAGVRWRAYAKAGPWLGRLDDLKADADGTAPDLSLARSGAGARAARLAKIALRNAMTTASGMPERVSRRRGVVVMERWQQGDIARIAVRCSHDAAAESHSAQAHATHFV